jgi:hypothetical protein
MLTPFARPPGLDSDNTAFSAGGGWADGNNVRFRFGRPETVGGSAALFTFFPANDLFAWARSGSGAIAYGLDNEVHIGSLSSATRRITGVPGTGGPGINNTGWSFAPWGSTLLAAQIGGTLYDQSGTSSGAEVTAAPNRIDAGILVTPQRQVMAFATNEVGGTFNPLCFRISDLEDYSSAGAWTPTATNNADEIIFDNGGAIVAGCLIGGYVAVWTKENLRLGQFIGDPGQSYRFDQVADVPGPVSRRSVVVLNGAAYWVGQDFRLYAWMPGNVPQAIPCPILRDVTDHAFAIGDQAISFMVTNKDFEEVWYFFGDQRDTPTLYPTRYIAYSIGESAASGRPVWFRGQLRRSAMLDSEIVRSLNVSYGTALVSTGVAGEVFVQEAANGETPVQGTEAYIQSTDQYIDNSQRRMMIKGIVPDFESQIGEVAVTLDCRDRPQSTAVTKGLYTLTTASTKMDFRASGKIMSVKFSSAERFRLGKPLFDIVPLGER